jgi:UDP-2,3-diacylglucosamine pyrophosphatase LpxH
MEIRRKKKSGATRPPPPQDYYPVVVISDTHLGIRNGVSDLLCEFLRHIRCDRLILNGDIIDGWRLNHRPPQRFPEAQARVLDALHCKIANGTEVIYIPGNHDAELRKRRLFGKKVFGIRFEESLDLEDARGKRLLVLHGDQLGPTPGVAYWLPRWLNHAFYDHFYMIATRVSATLDHLCHRLLHRHFGLLSRTRRIVERLNRHEERRENMALDYARRRGYDGIICGHFHMERVTAAGDGLLYLNSGDWVENFTALAMTEDGEWRIIRWGKHRHKLRFKRAFRIAAEENPDQSFRPETEKVIATIQRIWPGRKRDLLKPLRPFDKRKRPFHGSASPRD